VNRIRSLVAVAEHRVEVRRMGKVRILAMCSCSAWAISWPAAGRLDRCDRPCPGVSLAIRRLRRGGAPE